MNILIKQSKIALAYFLLIACLGVFLRLFMVVNIPTNYRYLVHAHSHVALLGWVYTAITILIYKMYLGKVNIEKKYRRLFWCTQVTIVGMLVTFPFTGYALFSIVFSTLFLIASYFFTWLVFKNTPKSQKETHSYKLIRAALLYMVVSSLGPWALGIIMSTLGSGSDLYRNAIYFYLHFQYNGWFILAIFGLLFYVLEQQNITLSKPLFRQFFWLINIGVIMTFGISLLWMKPSIWVNNIAMMGSVFQLLAFGVLIKQIQPFWKTLLGANSRLFSLLLKIITVLFAIKLIFQFVGSTPYFSSITTSNIDFVIGYIHWVFLGIVSVSLLGFLYYFKFVKLSKNDLLIYFIGFFLTEGFIFYKGIVVWQKLSLIDNYFWYLVIVSCIFLIGIMRIFIAQYRMALD